jgi:5-methylcytosine-specific restriction endonuclease McrA
VRVRDHIALSTAVAGLTAPYLGRGVLRLWAGSVLVDADHYVWFCVRRRHLSPLAAMRFFNQAHPPQHRSTRLFHNPVALAALLLSGAHRRGLLLVALGMSLHVALDARHEARMDEARAAALERDDFCCRACGARAPALDTHIWRQPWLLPSYGPENVISLCARCHEIAHLREPGGVAWS